MSPSYLYCCVPYCVAACTCVQGGGGWPSWNWEEFSVSYPSLSNQLCIGGVYVRLLLEGGDASGWRSKGLSNEEL